MSIKEKNILESAKSADDIQDGETNFPALVLGMISSIVLLFGVFGFGDDGRAEKARKRIADQQRAERIAVQEKNEVANRIVSATARKDDAVKIENATLGELALELTRLQGKIGKSIKDQAEFAQAKARVAEEILKKNPTGENRELAVCELIKAVNKLYGIDFTTQLKVKDVSSRLKNAYSPYLEDTNQSIYRSARIALLTHQSFENLKSGPNKETEELSAVFAETVTRFPEDEYVASMIEFHFEALEKVDSAFTARLFNDVQRKFLKTEQPSEVVKRLFQNLSDKFMMKEVDYVNKFENRWVYGAAGRRELVKVSLDLLKKGNLGRLLLRQVDRVGLWMERHGHQDDANMIYDALLVAAENNVEEGSREFAVRVAQSGIQRGSMTGKSFVFEGTDSVGNLLHQKDFYDKTVIIIFWSSRDPASVRYLASFDKNAYDLTTKAIRVLAVCVDETLDRDLPLFKRRAPCIRVVSHRDSEGILNSIYQQCPPTILPHTMLVDYDGNLADVNVRPDQIKNEALGLLLNRSD